jgi:TetR/AcrR family transcriptional regulator, repressor for neighboring sulfatase
VTAPTTPAPSGHRGPRGEDEVREALIAAGAQLFAERGPAHVSVKQVAAAAHVNHGLVHHYFGSKDSLVVAVLESLSEDAARELADHEPTAVIYATDGPTERHGRILAHLILAGEDPIGFKTDFPAVHHLIDRYRNQGMTAAQARTRAAQVIALVLGWQFFEPFVTAAAGLEPSDRTRKRMLDDAVRRLTS